MNERRNTRLRRVGMEDEKRRGRRDGKRRG